MVIVLHPMAGTIPHQTPIGLSWFHQFSSRELIASFSGLDEGRKKLDTCTEETSSPKLPTSVSKSRGKHYKSRAWEKEKQKGTLSKRHPVKHLSSKGLLVKVGSDKAPKKDGSCCMNGNEKPRLRSISNSESSLTEVSGMNSLRSVSNSADIKNHRNAIASGIVVHSHATGTVTSDDTIQKKHISSEVPSHTTSTITSDDTIEQQHKSSEVPSHTTNTITSDDTILQQQQWKSSEVPSRVLGHTSGLLSALRVTLRKSCATRPASRFEVNHAKQGEGRTSSSGQSSVGSSSNHGYERKNMRTRVKKDKTPESRAVTRLSHAPDGKVRRHQHTGPNVLVPRKVNGCSYPTDVAKAKEVKGAVCSKSARAGKENKTGKIAAVQKPSDRDKSSAAVMKSKDRTTSGKCSGTLSCPKVNVGQKPSLSQKSSTLDKGAKVANQAQNITKGRGLKRGTEKLFVVPEERTSGKTEAMKKGCTNATTGKVYLR